MLRFLIEEPVKDGETLKLIPLIRFWGLWFLSTCFLCLLVLLAQMYAREDTLDSVREIDFKVVYKALGSNGVELPEKTFKTITDELTIFDGKVVLFPMALISKSSCIHNGLANDSSSICTRFETLDNWHEEFTTTAKRNKYTPYQYGSYADRSYIYQFLSSGHLLIGAAGDYSSINPYARPMTTFYRKVLGYYLGTFSGVAKVFAKGKWATVFIFASSLVSTLGFLLVKRILENRHAYRIRQLEAKLTQKDSEWTHLQKENGEINLRLREKNKELIALQKAIQKDKEINDQVSEDLLSQAISLEGERDELTCERNTLQVRIIELEEEIEQIAQRQLEQSDSGSRNDLVKELVKARSDYQELIKLWRRKTNWNHRLTIESKVSTDPKRVPFTVSTAFIAFENYIDQLFDRDFSRSDDLEPTLSEKINTIGGDNPELRNLMHSIRKARNNWFHDGSAPQYGLIKELISLIEKEEPRI